MHCFVNSVAKNFKLLFTNFKHYLIKPNCSMARKAFVIISIILVSKVILVSLFVTPIWWLFVIQAPLVILGIYDMTQTKHAIRRNFPVIGNLRYMLEGVRPEIIQYFIETYTEGRPLDRIDRPLIYRRAQNVSDTSPFGA